MKYLALVVLVFVWSCAMETKFVQQKPEEGKSILVGAVLVENDGVEDVYEAKTAKIVVVIVGKSVQDETEGYRIKTDDNGYYLIQNVPAGSYVIKGIEVDIAYGTRMMISSRWDGNTQIYYPINTMIDNTVRAWPDPSEEKIINMGISYYKIDLAGRIASDRFKGLENATLGLANKTYTMPNPLIYFREKFSDWTWFQ